MDNKAKSTRDLLLENKALFESGAISQREYEEKKKELLEAANALRKRKKASNLTTWIVSALIILIGGCIIYTILYNAFFKPQPDYDNYFKAIDTYLNTSDAITYYEAEGNRVNLYVDSNIWNASSKQEKAEFCYITNEALSKYCVFYNIDEYMAYVYYYTEKGVKVAEPKSMSLESEILY